METPRQDHMVAVRHILRYIAGTIDSSVHYGRGDGSVTTLAGYSESATVSWQAMTTTGRISWQSQKQRVLAQLSHEAECVARCCFLSGSLVGSAANGYHRSSVSAAKTAGG